MCMTCGCGKPECQGCGKSTTPGQYLCPKCHAMVKQAHIVSAHGVRRMERSR